MDRWQKKLNLQMAYDGYTILFTNLYKLRDSVKLIDFQYRLLFGKIFVNDTLFHWKIILSNICDICHAEKQTIIHLMYQCQMICIIYGKV